MKYKALYTVTAVAYLFILYRLMKVFNEVSFVAEDGWTLTGGYIFAAVLLVALPFAVGIGAILLSSRGR